MKIPEFKDEREEAEWFDTHEEEIFKAFQEADAEGRLTVGTLVNERPPAATIQLDPDDVSKAHDLAEKRGLAYPAYLKMLVHQALQEEENKLIKAG